MYDILTIFAGFIFLFSAVAGGLARTSFSGPIIFCAFGWLIGPLALGWFDADVGADGLRLLAELTLALVLFTDRNYNHVIAAEPKVWSTAVFHSKEWGSRDTRLVIRAG